MLISLDRILQTIESGSRPKGGVRESESGIPSLGAEHLNSTGGFNFGKIKYVPESFFNNQKKGIIEENDILIVKDGATTGKVSFVDNNFQYQKASINEHLFKITINKNKVIPKYVFWHLFSTRGLKQILKDFRGATVGGISRGFVNNVYFPLPSLSEQLKIVTHLDNAYSLIEKRKKVMLLLDDYIDSVFYKMFVQKSNKEIPLAKLQDISTKITDGVHFKPKYTELGVPFISVTNKKLDFNNSKFISYEDHIKYISRCKAEQGDVLYTKVGATYGRACVVDSSREFSLYVSVALIKPKASLITPIYLKSVLNSKFVKHQADRSIKGIGVPDLHLIEIKNLNIPLPKIEEQNKFTQIVQRIEEIKQKMLAQSKELETQFQALMQKSFATL